jgi:hypothetical protein
MHRVALTVEPLAQSIRDFHAEGILEGLNAGVMPGAIFAMMDTVAAYGHSSNFIRGA